MKSIGIRITLAATAAAVGLALVIPGVSGAIDSPAAAPAPAADPAVLAAAAADRAANSGYDALAKGPDESFLRRDVVSGSGGFQYVSYERTYRGLPVLGGDAVVVTDAKGTVRDTASALGRGVTLTTTTPKITAARAEGVARKQLDKVRQLTPAQLAVHAGERGDRLAYAVVLEGVKAGAPSRLHVVVDASTSAVLDVRDDVRMGTGNGYYNGQVSITTSGSGSSWSMTDNTRPGIRCGGQNGAAYTGTDDAWGNGSGTNLETACVDALYAVQREWDMLSSWLGRNGINGNGGGFPARVGLAEVNAYWNGSYTNFGRNQAGTGQATPIDVVAHEYGHAIFQTTPGGAGSGNENGGINESTGDIFGALTEAYANNPNDPPDYLVGEEVNLVGQGPIRNMYNPQALGDPNCYSSAIPNTEVHAAAGPNNHWFYLTAIGSAGGGGNPASPTCNGSTVTGIGIQKAGQIYMAALNMKTSSWRYVNVRTATLRAAVNLFGASSAECRTVKAAWDAVSVPAQSGEAQCSIAPGNDFSLTVSPGSGTVQRGSSVSTTVSTATTSGSAQTVSLTASGLPSGVTASFSPSSVTSGGSSTLTLTASASAATGSAAVTVTGTGPNATHTATYTVTVTTVPGGDDFAVSLSPASATVAAGGSTSASVGTTTTSGSAQTVNLSVTGAPTGVTASVSPSTVTSGAGATLSVAVGASAAPGTYTLTVTGAGSSATRTATFTLTVTGGGGGCGSLPAWSSATAYVPDDLVSHNGRRWKATWWSTGAEPGAPGSWAVWSDQGAC
ncbi:zinc metalloprotease [Catellatospora sp. IY07-71]|uniref:M4 family metallopeptidase n=1 Tax=Catellatospora sp. IY07-71 TaxID=2728827 RepID=UPI001BB3C165|nr:M4 family metallopeptidase [Catellatospora sp. IY07-71]BCJ76542.1 zinc metalloprotease [Catellatospora sp. IY07-71]